MGFYDEGLYENVLRHRTSPATAIVFALTFDSSGNYLATATTTGILKIFSLPHVASASPSPSPSLTISAHDLSRYGSINSLESTETSLYVGTDCCLIRFSWESMVGVPDAQHRSTDKVEQFLATVQINTLGKLADGKKVVVGCGRGEFYLVEDGKGKLEPIGGPIGSAAYPHCIATMPNDPDIFLAVRQRFPFLLRT